MSLQRVGQSVLAAGVVLLGVAGCFLEENPTGTNNTHKGVSVFISEADFKSNSSILERMQPGSTTVSPVDIPMYSDIVLRQYSGMLYIIERDGADNIIKIDPSTTTGSMVFYQVHLGDGWNPQDIEFISDTKAYIANQNEPEITVFNPENGSVTGHIKIDAYTYMPDSNSSPYASQMACVGKVCYVALQQRNGWAVGAPTLILAIDTRADTIIIKDSIRCRYGNNYDMVAVDNALYCTNQGSIFTTGDGAIEKVDLESGEVTTIITEDDLGGNPNLLVHKKGSLFYLQNYRGWLDVSVVEIDVDEGSIVDELEEISDGYGGLFYDNETETLYVGDRDSTDAGVVLFTNNKKVEGPLHSSGSLPPTGIIVVR